MRITDGQTHLTYCTNIHAAESWKETLSSLVEYCLPLKKRLAPDAPFGIGLRLSNRAADELLQGEQLQQFANWLAQQHLYVFTLNGFPYGEFHRHPVRTSAYAPDWQTPERFSYTLKLARILAALLPDGMDGSISTLPLTYRPWLSKHVAAYDAACASCCRNLALLAVELARIREQTGKLLHVDLEPEPDCLLDCSSDVILFYNEWLLGAGRELIACALACSLDQAETILREHLRICYDVCHFAIAWEAPANTFRRLHAEGISIGKVQLSSALQLLLPEDPEQRCDIVQYLQEFSDGTWLHQVSIRHEDGTCLNYPDLAVAMPQLDVSGRQNWRIHYHVPLFLEHYGALSSTQPVVVEALQCLQRQSICHHLEIETYTWSVLPAMLKTDLLQSIEREYRWVLQQTGNDTSASIRSFALPEVACNEPLC